MRVFQNYHRHSVYTNIKIPDSVATNEQYAIKASELGHGIISTMEHGFQGRYIEGYELAKKYNLKFVFGTEAYWVKDRFEKDNTNAHICIFAKTENARQCINDILAEANISGFYYQPRLDLDLIYSLPSDEVIITSACIGFWKYQDDSIIEGLKKYFGNNFFLEVQYHNTEKQIILNKHIIKLSSKYNIPLIMGCDSHFITLDTSWERDEYIKSKGIEYEDEEGWYLDYPDGDTAYNRFIEQNVLTPIQIEEAMENTNIFLSVEEYNNSCFNQEIKMPTLYPKLSQQEKDKLYIDLIWEKWEVEKKRIPKDKHRLYISEIQKEIDAIIETKHSDYFLLDYKLVKESIKRGATITPTGRGCFTKDALLHTKNTMKSISNIKIGDEVICADGNFHKVIETLEYDINEELVQIKHLYGTDKYYPAICTKDHKIFIHRNNENIWCEAQYIYNDDFVCVPKMKINNTQQEEYIDLNQYNIFGYKYDNNYIYEFKPCKNNAYQYSPTEIAKILKIGKSTVEKFANGDTTAFANLPQHKKLFFELFPFKTQEEYVKFIKDKRTIRINRFIKNDKIFNIFIGLMYGDGFRTCNRNTSIGLAINSSNEKDSYNKKIFFEIAKRIGIDVYINDSKTKQLSQLHMNSKIISEFVAKELFVSKIHKEKDFNSKLFNQNIENLNGIIDGLLASDGSFSERRISFDNTSKSIINAYKIMCLITKKGINSINVRPAYINKRGWSCKESYKLRINPNYKNIKKKNEKIKEDDNFWYLPIKKIIFLPKQKNKVYDITVENQHNYLINNMIVHNSSVSYYTNKLLGFTKVDRIISEVKMYPERFISPTRIIESKSLADLDLNFGNTEIAIQVQKELIGEEHSYPMIAYGTMKAKSAWNMYAKAKDIKFELAQTVSEQIEKYEQELNHAEEDDVNDIDIFEYVDEQYHEILKDSEKYLGLVSDIKVHTCGFLLFQGNIRKEIGLIKTKSKSGKKEVLCTIMDGKWAEDYKFMKNDLLTVSVVDIIYRTYKRINKEIDDVIDLISMNRNDKKTWDIYKNGYTIGINQVEKRGTKHRIMQYKPQNISELTAFIAAIRPGFKSMYKTFANREEFNYGIPIFDNLIQTIEMPSSFVLYQEMVMTALNFAGIPMSECYEIIKCISKKRVDKIKSFQKVFLTGFSKKIIDIEKTDKIEAKKIADKIWQIISDSSKYSFNASHAYCMANDSLYGAYLKSHYPLEFYETFLRIMNEKGNKKERMKDAQKEAEKAFGIRFMPFRFRQNNQDIMADEKTNTITNTLKSIKGFGDKQGEQLYSLRDNIYEGFIDLLVDMAEKKILCTKIEDLIKIQFFNEFGNNGKLLKLYNAFIKGDNKYDRKYIAKTKESRIDALKFLEMSLPNERIPIKEQMDFENDILGYTQVTCNIREEYVYVQNLDTKYSPKAQLYCLQNSNCGTMKIQKKIFNKTPFKKNDIILIKKSETKPQMQKVGDSFIPVVGTKEYWILEYDIIKDIDKILDMQK